MVILRALKRALPRDRVIVYECRRCGTNVDSESEVCPICERNSIARYEIR